jgi:Transglycosylase SLT domain
MKKVLVVAAAGLALAGLIPCMATWAVLPEMLSAGAVATPTEAQNPAPPVAVGPGADAIPPAMAALYRAGAATCPGLPWSVLAAIGTVESDNGRSNLPGVHSGANQAGAEGPMQFEPATFAMYDQPVPAGGLAPPSPYDPVDAVFAAARMLCADGAGTPAALGQAVFDYNHSGAYVAQVLAVARSYGYPGT